MEVYIDANLGGFSGGSATSSTKSGRCFFVDAKLSPEPTQLNVFFAKKTHGKKKQHSWVKNVVLF